MKILLLGLFLFGGSGFGQSLENLVVTGTAATWLGTGPTLSSFTVEIGFTTAASATLVSVSGFSCGMDGSYNLGCSLSADGQANGIPTTAQAASQDVRMRFYRDAVSNTYMMESWTGACTNYQARMFNPSNSPLTTTLASAATWSVGPSSLRFLRIYSTLQTSHTCPLDAPTTTADVADWSWENSSGGTNISRDSNHYTMTLNGATYAT